MRVTALVPIDGTDDRSAERAIRELLESERVDEILLVTRSELDVTLFGDDTDLLVVHDPRRALASGEVVRSVVDIVRSGEAAAVAARPVTDTIKIIDPGGVLRSTWERHRLRQIDSPLCCRRELVAGLGRVPTLEDLSPGQVRLVPSASGSGSG